MKTFFPFFKRCRSLILIVFAVVMLVAAGITVGTRSASPVLQQASAASPLWHCYFGKVNPGAHYGEKNITASDYANNYGKFEVTTNSDPYFYPGSASTLSGGGTSGSINANNAKVLVIRYWSDVEDASIQLFFGASSIEGVSGRYTSSQHLENDGRWHDLYINMSSYSGWTGTINKMRFDLDGFAAGKVLWISFIAAFDTTENARTWAKASVSMGNITTQTQTQTGTKTVYTPGSSIGSVNITGKKNLTTEDRSADGALNQFVAYPSSNLVDWACMILIEDPSGSGLYRLVGVKTYGNTNVDGQGVTIQHFFNNYKTQLIATRNPGCADWQTLWNSFQSDKNYMRIEGTKLYVYNTYTKTTEPIYTTTTTTTPVSAPVAVDYQDLDTSKMTGSISMSGGSTSTSDYTSAPSTRRFYRSNLGQYLAYDGSTTTMSFSYSSVATPYVISLPDATKGLAVAKIAIYYSSDSNSNNSDGAIQWTRVKSASGTVNFQDSSTASVGSYYDQDVVYSGYGATDNAVYKGCDKYIYHGSFAHNVLPAGTYKAKLQYDVLFDKYIVVQPTGIATAQFDGVNLRTRPGSGAFCKYGTTTEVSENPSLIVSIPAGTNIYVGYDSYDTSTGTTGGSSPTTFNLNGGVFYKGSADTTWYSKDRVWRLATCVINGVYYEGWIDTGLTNYATKIATASNLKSTSGASLSDLVMVPRRYENTTGLTYNYGTWEPYGYTKASTSDFAVRWSWSFNSEANVKAFTTNYNEVSNTYHGNSQVEFNTNNFVTLTSTSASGSTKEMWLGHYFTSSRNYSKYSSINTQNTDSVAHAATGVAKIVYMDPLNVKNHGSSAYLALVYRSQDNVNSANTMRVFLRDYMYFNGSSSGGAYDVYTDVTLTSDGKWNTAVVNLSNLADWTVSSDPSGYDGLRLGELVEMYFRFFNASGNIAGGKSIDLAAVGIFTSSSEASGFGTKYVAQYLGTQKGSVKAISTSNGTISLAVGGSGSASSTSLLTGVTAGSTFKVTVTPASGYYCSKLCWRPTGYILNGMVGKTNSSGATYFSPNSSSLNSSVVTGAATEYVNVLDSNFINNGLFGTSANTTAATGWQNSSWGNNLIMTTQQIGAYNDMLVNEYAGSTRSDQPVVITDMSAKDVLTTATIQSYINALCTESNASTWGLSSAYTNRNYSAVNASNIKLGIVTKRSNIRNLPTASEYIDGSNHDVVCESGIAYATPVWVLHTSTDGKFYFVQCPYYRGWVDSTAIATTTDYGYWLGFASPAFRGDFVVTTARALTINSTTAEMGCAFEHVSTSGSNYTIKIPTRASDGTLSHTTTTVANTNASLGYLPYTWNNYVAQAFKYLGTAYSWADEDAGRVDCSAFAQYVLKTFGFKIMRNSSQQAGTGYTTIVNGKTYSYSTHDYYELAQFSGTPMILTGSGHTVLYLGTIGGKHYIIHSPSVGKNVVVEEISEANLAKWSNYTIFAPNNYLEEARLRKLISATGSAFTATIETPAYNTYSSSTKYMLNDSVHAEESVLLDKNSYADKYVLNAGGRDIYVWAVFEKIKSEVAIDIQLQIPDGYSVTGPQLYAGITYSSGHTNVAEIHEKDSGSTKNVRLTVFKGFKIVDIKVSGGVSRSGGIVKGTANGIGAVVNYSDTFQGTTISQNGPIYPSYTGVDTNTYGTTDGGITFVIQPTSYTVQYNSNYPSGTQTTITGTHYYNCTGNIVNSTASFTAAQGPGGKWSASKNLSYANHNFLGWSASASGVVKYAKGTTYDYSKSVNTLFTSGKQGETYNLYGVWVPVNYNLSVEYVSQLDRELIGTPDGFCVKVGSTTLGKNDVVTSQTPLNVDISKYGANVARAEVTYADNILSIKTTGSDAYCSVDIPSDKITTYDMIKYKYMTITYRLSTGTQANLIYFLTNSDSSYTKKTGATDANCVSPGWIGDGEWHTITINMSEMYRFYHTNQYLKALRLPGGATTNSVLDIASIKLYQNPPTIWGDSTTPNASGSSTALTKQGHYTFVHTANKSTAVNVISAQQADYDFVMDLKKAYMFFYNTSITDAEPLYTSSEYSSSGYNSTFGTPVTVTINGVSMLGYDVSSYIKNHTFDMSSASFTMPACDVKLVFVCDYVNYNVKVFTYTAGASYGTIPSTSLSNTAGTVSNPFSEATITIASSKNDGIVGRYGSTVTLSVSNIVSGKKFLGWYEKTNDASNTSGNAAYGKLISTATSFTLSANLHKDMEVVAVFGSNTSTNTTFNFTNVSGQVIQTLVGTKGSYIPVTNITARPYKSGSAFSHWEFLKNADRTKATTTTYNSKTYYLLDGTTQPTYKYSYSVLYSDKNCTQPAYIYVNGAGGTVNIDAAYTKLSTGTVKLTISGSNATINGGSSATVTYNTTVTAKATGTSAFKCWIDMTVGTTRYTAESHKVGDYYYPIVSYDKEFSFKAIRAMTLSAIYASVSEADKKPNISITPIIQRVDMGTYYKYTAFGFLTINPGTTYEILEWGTLFFLAPDANTVPTTTSFDVATGTMKTTNILTTDTPTTYLQKNTNSSYSEVSAAGQYASNANVGSARTVYVRMYCRYSFTNSTTGETEYVVTYSDTYKFTSAAYTSGNANTFIEPTLYETVDLKPSDFNDLW